MNKKILIGILIIIIIAVGGFLFINLQEDNVNTNVVNDTVQESSVSMALKMTYKGVDVTPGEAFNKDDIDGEAERSEIPSCAFEGTDNVYTYEDVEIIATDIDGQETVYSVYFLSAELETPEGVKVSDEASKVIEIYGDTYEENGNEMIYKEGDVILSFIVENDIITSIEYTYNY